MHGSRRTVHRRVRRGLPRVRRLQARRPLHRIGGRLRRRERRRLQAHGGLHLSGLVCGTRRRLRPIERVLQGHGRLPDGRAMRWERTRVCGRYERRLRAVHDVQEVWAVYCCGRWLCRHERIGLPQLSPMPRARAVHVQVRRVRCGNTNGLRGLGRLQELGPLLARRRQVQSRALPRLQERQCLHQRPALHAQVRRVRPRAIAEANHESSRCRTPHPDATLFARELP